MVWCGVVLVHGDLLEVEGRIGFLICLFVCLFGFLGSLIMLRTVVVHLLNCFIRLSCFIVGEGLRSSVKNGYLFNT